MKLSPLILIIITQLSCFISYSPDQNSTDMERIDVKSILIKDALTYGDEYFSPRGSAIDAICIGDASGFKHCATQVEDRSVYRLSELDNNYSKVLEEPEVCISNGAFTSVFLGLRGYVEVSFDNDIFVGDRVFVFKAGPACNAEAVFEIFARNEKGDLRRLRCEPQNGYPSVCYL